MSKRKAHPFGWANAALGDVFADGVVAAGALLGDFLTVAGNLLLDLVVANPHIGVTGTGHLAAADLTLDGARLTLLGSLHAKGVGQRRKGIEGAVGGSQLLSERNCCCSSCSY